MKNSGRMNKIWAVMLCVLLLVGCVQTAMAADCAHENYREGSYTIHIELNQGESWKPNADGETHSAYGKEYYQYYCYDCSGYFKMLNKSGLLTRDHYLSDGVCNSCGYGCSHENVRYSEDSYYLKDGHQWKADSNGTTHSALCLQFDYYYCYDCYYSWKENVVEKTIKNSHSWNNGKCNYCSYVCPHDDLEVTKDYYTLDIGEEWKANSDGKTHSGLCQQYDYYRCPDCYKSWRENEVTKTIKEEHRWGYSDDGENYCWECDYVCLHEEIELEYRNVRFYHDDGWKDDCNGLTHSRLADVFDQYRCLECDAYLKKNLVTQTLTEYHYGTNQCYDCKTYNIIERSSWWINEQPKNVNASIGDKITMQVGTWQNDNVGRPTDEYILTYQWYYRNAGSAEVKKSSITKPTYSTTMTAAMAGRELYCVVTDQYGYKQYSAVATILVPELKMTIQPKDQTVSAGETAKFTVKAEGEGLEYQWYYRKNSSAAWSKASSTSATYSFAMKESFHNRQIRCVVTDAYHKTVTSKTVLLKLPVATITKQPSNAWAYEGNTAKVTVEATGDGLTYTWYYKDPGKTDFTKSTNTTKTSSTKMTAARDGRQLYCVVGDAYGKSVQTKTVTLDTRFKATITSQPSDVKKFLGETAEFSVKATGDGLTYAWYYKNPGDASFSKTSATGASTSVKMTEARDGRQMYCVVKDQYGNKVQSETATMTAKKTVNITKQPANAYAYENESAKVSVTATGDGLTYTWYYKDPGKTGFTKSTNTTKTSSTKMTAARDGRQLYCVVTDEYGNSKTTDTVTLSIRYKATITGQPSSVQLFEDETAKFSVKATGDGLTYAWYYKNPGDASFSKTSATGASTSVKMTEARDGRQMYCVVKDQYGNTAQSSTATMTMKRRATITTQPKSATKAVGETVKFTVKATGDGLRYQWYYIKAGSSTPNTASSTSASYSFAMKESFDGRQIYCVVTDKYGNSVTSSKVKLTLE